MFKDVLLAASPTICGLIVSIVAQVCYMMSYQYYIWDSHVDRNIDLHSVAIQAHCITFIIGMLTFSCIMII